MFSSELDNPLLSDGEVSAHGWWMAGNNECRRYAEVENWLQQWTCDASGGNCNWVEVAHNETRVGPGGRRGRRNTARRQCATSTLTGYRNMVDVELVGVFDPADRRYRIVDFGCRATANGGRYYG